MVERNLAKVEVESSRLFSRSNLKGSTFNLLPFFIEATTAPVLAAGKFFSLYRTRRGNKAVMYRIANPASPVRLRAAPPFSPGLQLAEGFFVSQYGRHAVQPEW